MGKVLHKKPGPKSTKQRKILSKRGTLGDATCTSSDDSTAGENLVIRALRTPELESSERVQSSVAISEFRTPDPENDATDYGLEFTTSQIQNPSPRRCSTLRTAGSSQEEQSDNINAQKSVNDNETPTTSISTNSLAKLKPHRKATHTKPVAKTKNTSTPAPQISAAVTQPAKKPRKQRNPLQLEKRFWKEVLALQNHTGHLVPVLPFSRLVRELMLDSSTSITRITVTALQALQTASEMYLTQVLQDAYMLTLHRGRVTLQVEDMKLLNYLKNNS